jgi:hypothetical protein
MNEDRKSIQDLERKSAGYRREIQQGKWKLWGKKNQAEVLEIKTSINQIQTTMDSIIRR